ncbi:MAG: GNAT family N-acetyltransferase [Clostridiales bacterium]|nr:GNAT family N-acetyltransferase [Clostridiales bacterium]
MVSFRPASQADIEAIFALSREQIDRYEDLLSVDYDAVLFWLRRKIKTHITEYRVILLDGEPAGYYHLQALPGRWELEDFYLLPQYRGRGIGTQALCTLLSHCRTPVFLYVFVSNTKAVSFYQRLGFQIVDRVHNTRYRMRYESGF